MVLYESWLSVVVAAALLSAILLHSHRLISPRSLYLANTAPVALQICLSPVFILASSKTFRRHQAQWLCHKRIKGRFRTLKNVLGWYASGAVFGTILFLVALLL